MSGRRARIVLRGVQVFLALFFVIASALPKLIAHQSAAEAFDEMGWGGAVPGWSPSGSSNWPEVSRC